MSTPRRSGDALRGVYAAVAETPPKADASVHACCRSGEILPGASCSACKVLRQELGRLQFHVDSELQRAEARTASCALDERAYQEACRIMQIAERDRIDMEERSAVAQKKLELQQQSQRTILLTWEDEVLAWRTLCEDTQSAVSAACKRAGEYEATRGVSDAARDELHAGLHAARAELQELHSVQSAVEAQRLQDARDEAREAQHFQRQHDAIDQQITGLNSTIAALAEGLNFKRSQLLDVERSIDEEREMQARLEKEMAEARAHMLALRAECDDQRHACNQLVRSLGAAERGQRPPSPQPVGIEVLPRGGQSPGQSRTRSSSTLTRKSRRRVAQRCRSPTGPRTRGRARSSPCAGGVVMNAR